MKPVVVQLGRAQGAAGGPALPPWRTQAVNFAGAVGRTVGRALSGRAVIAPKEVRDQRRAICQSNVCGKYRAEDGRCSMCGCPCGDRVMDKTSWAGERCPHPERYWAAVEVE